MLKKAILLSITILTALFFIMPVRAEDMGARSIEWLACDAEIIAVGHLKEVRQLKGDYEVVYEDCTLTVTELLKSSAQKDEVDFTFRRLSHDPSMADWLRDDVELLVFLKTSRDHGSEKHLDGALVPASMQFPLSLVNLAEPGKFLIDTKFIVLKYGWEVTEATRAGLLTLNNYQFTEGNKKVEAVRVEVPMGTEAHTMLNAGSTCYLGVPNFMAPANHKSSP